MSKITEILKKWNKTHNKNKIQIKNTKNTKLFSYKS